MPGPERGATRPSDRGVSSLPCWLTALVLLGLAACSGVGDAAPGATGREEGTPSAVGAAPVDEPSSDTAGFVRVGEARLYYTAHGEGAPLLVVHGGPGLDQAYMRPWFDELADVARVVHYDQRGTGRSAAPLTADALAFSEFVNDIDRIREAFGWDRFTLLGHSWGGLLAVAYARQYAARLEGLVLVSPAEPGTQFAALAAQRNQNARSPEAQARIQELLASDGYVQGESETVSEIFRLVFAGTLADPSDIDLLDLDLAESTARQRDRVTSLLQQGMVQPEWWSELRAVAVPTLVLHGRHDPLPIEMASALADSMPDARLVTLRDSGHFPFAEEPEVVLSEVRSFLSGLESGPG